MEIYVNAPAPQYNVDRDFTSLVCWRDATKNVKLFFYNKVIPKLPYEEKKNLDIQTQIQPKHLNTISKIHLISSNSPKIHPYIPIPFIPIHNNSIN
jgi:hypothetical protein